MLPLLSVALATAPPNIVLIVADDLGYGDVGCYGATDIQTPNIDALANGGIRLTNGYVVSPICAPSRAGLMTGRYPQKFGFEYNLDHRSAQNNNFGVPTSQTMLAERLKARGYSTGLVGKWHMGLQPGLTPNDRGFDYFYGFLGGGAPYIYPAANNVQPIIENGVPSTPTQYLTDQFSDKAVSFINDHATQPFFLYVAYNAPHTPLQVTQNYLDRYPNLTGDRQKIAGMVSAMDDGIGRVQTALDNNGLSNNTLVIFISDNGGVLSNGSSNGVLRGQKYEVTEGGIRVPFVAKWPGHLAAHSTLDVPVTALDLVPTLMSMVGAPINDGSVDGVDLLHFLTGANSAPSRNLFWRFGGKEAMRSGNTKLVREDDDEELELFNLSSDIGEATDLAPANSSSVSSLDATYQSWETGLISPLWGPIPDPSTQSLILYKQTSSTWLQAVTVDYQGNPISSLPFKTFNGVDTAKIGRMRPEADIDVAVIEGNQIVVRSWLNSGLKLPNLTFQNKGATKLIGFADFNGNGRNELVFQTPDGFKGAEISPETGQLDYIVMTVDVPFGSFDRVLGFGDMDDDGGPDMIVADVNDKISYMYFNGKRSQRVTRKFFNPNFVPDPAAQARQYVGALDINGDGSIDILNDPYSAQATAPQSTSSIWFLTRLKPEIKTKDVVLSGDWHPIALGAVNLPDPFDE